LAVRPLDVLVVAGGGGGGADRVAPAVDPLPDRVSRGGALDPPSLRV
jgi:hypothetical protein